MSLYMRTAAHIAVDISGRPWPTTADVRDIARRAAAADLGFDLTEDDTHAYLARAALGFEPLAEGFPDRQKLASATIFTTAALLVSYHGHGTDWLDYLNTIETALETAAPLPEDVEPAVLLLYRRNARSGSNPPAGLP
jgi:hypothetical protein